MENRKFRPISEKKNLVWKKIEKTHQKKKYEQLVKRSCASDEDDDSERERERVVGYVQFIVVLAILFLPNS